MAQETDNHKPRFSAPPVREVGADAVLRWLKQGWRDLRASGWPSLMHGLIVAAVSVVIVEIALLFWPLLPGAVSGFLVVGPILATGLYALSSQLEQGSRPGKQHVFEAWRRGTRCLYRFGLLLVLAGTTWVLFSMSLFHYFVSTEIERPIDFLRYILQQNDGIFLLWTILAGLVAAVTFAVTVVSVPLLVDRDVNTPLALATSIRAVAENPVPMTLWALLILLATGFSVATFMLGFIVLYPVLGHASWYVYRDIVDASQLPPRQPVD